MEPEVLTAVSMNMAVFWVIALCSLVEIYDVSEVLAASLIALMMEARSASEMLLNFYQTTRLQASGQTSSDIYLESSTCSFISSIFLVAVRK
jgi:hypothetical protein